jgi:hypothetical protein
MAFTVEDGTGVAAANSYQAIADIKAYFTDRGLDIAAVPYTDAEIQASAVRATDYMDKRFGRRYRGYKRSKAQGREWPRLSALDDDQFELDPLPNPLLYAHSEYTLLDLQLSTLSPLPDTPFPTVDPATGTVSTGTGQLVSAKDAVGPIETERQYSDANSNKPMTSSGNFIQSVREYPVADLWMEEILISTTSRDLARG